MPYREQCSACRLRVLAIDIAPLALYTDGQRGRERWAPRGSAVGERRVAPPGNGAEKERAS
jgi:hypothetical protein